MKETGEKTERLKSGGGDYRGMCRTASRRE
jgi:hypothetical protein